MRRFLAIGLCVSLTAPSWGAIAFVQKNNVAAGTNPDTIVISGRTSGNLLVLCLQAQSGGAAPTSVTSSDSWTASPKTMAAGLGVNHEGIYYAIASGSGNDTITITWAANYSYRKVTVYEFSGVDTSNPLITDEKANGTSTAVATPSLSISGNAVIVAALEEDSGGGSPGFTPGTGYTAESSDGTYIHTMYHITSGSEAATGTITASLNWVILGVAFREAGGGTGPTLPPMRTLLGVGR